MAHIVSAILRSFVVSVRRTFEWNGRSSRFEFWSFLLVAGLLAAAVLLFVPVVEFAVAGLLLLVPSTLAASVRRIQDTGRSKWWPVCAFLSVAVVYPGFVFALSFLIGAGRYSGLVGIFWALVGLVPLACFLVVVLVFLLRNAPAGEDESCTRARAS